MSKRTVRCGIIAMLVALAGVAAHARNPIDEERKNTLALYAWGTSVNGTMTIQGDRVPVDVSFKDILDKLDFGGSIHYEWAPRPWGLVLDSTYVDLSSDFVDPETGTPGSQNMQFLLGEALAQRRWGPSTNHVTFDILLGFRIWSLQQEIAFTGFPPFDGDETWVDGVLGARVMAPFGKRWMANLRVDVAKGSSDIAWNGVVTFAWQFSRPAALVMGYRYLSEDYDTGTGAELFALDADLSGIMLGFAFSW